MRLGDWTCCAKASGPGNGALSQNPTWSGGMSHQVQWVTAMKRGVTCVSNRDQARRSLDSEMDSLGKRSGPRFATGETGEDAS
jgi:hypothetical protein